MKICKKHQTKTVCFFLKKRVFLNSGTLGLVCDAKRLRGHLVGCCVPFH